MTERQWSMATDPTPMLEFLRGKVSNRKLRLCAVACCRHVWDWLPKYSRNAVEVAERYADKKATRVEMSHARRCVDEDCAAAGYWDGSMGCGYFAACWGVWETVTHAVVNAAIAPRSPEWLKVVSAKRKTPVMHEAAGRTSRRLRDAQNQAFCILLRDMMAPFQPVVFKQPWLSSTVVDIAQGMYESRDFTAMPILADALQDAGCDNDDILNHCQQPGKHVRGCWVVDLVLSKE